jgi:hypothetical protein
VFTFRLDEDVSLGEIEVAFTELWRAFTEDHSLDVRGLGGDRLFWVLLESINQLLDEAIKHNVLNAHEALSAARHRVVCDRLDHLQAQRSVGFSVDTDTNEQISAFEQRLRAEVGARHQKIKPPSLQGTHPVPIDQLYVAPTLRPMGEPDANGITLESFLSSTFRRVVLGHPGAGKSTLTFKVCAMMTARYDDALVVERKLTPWRIELRKFAAASERTSLSLVDYFDQLASKSHHLDVPAGAFLRLLDAGRLFVIFDGLDELLDVARRVEVRDQVESFCRRFTRTPVLITSRHVDYTHAPLDRAIFEAFDLGEFTEPQIIEYAGKWFRRDSTLDLLEQEEKIEAFLRESLIVRDLRQNPLMLALLCAFYGGRGFIPRNLSDVYGNCAQLLFDTWDRTRGIVAELSFSEHIRPALDDLAYWMMSDSRLLANGATRAQAVARTTTFLQRRRFASRDRARSAAEQFITHCCGRAWVFTDQSTTKTGEDLFGFTHRAFLEYFAAEQLAASYVTPEALVDALIERIVKGEWQVVSRIALQIKARSLTEGADAVINALRSHAKARAAAEQIMVLRFILGSLGALVPSPKTARALAVHTLAVVAAQIDGAEPDIELGFSLIEDFGRGGAELSEQLVEGAAAVIGAVISKRGPRTARFAGELAFCVAETIRVDSPASEAAREFWAQVRRQVLAYHGADLEARIGEDAYVACLHAMATGDLDRVLSNHGVGAIFVSFQPVLPRIERWSIAQMLSSSMGKDDAARRASIAALAKVGVAMRDADTPWVADAKRALASVNVVNALSEDDVRQMPEATWLGLWGIGAVATEVQANEKNGALGLHVTRRKARQLTPLGGLAEIWARRGGRPSVSLAKALDAVPFATDDREIVWSWASREIDVIAPADKV